MAPDSQKNAKPKKQKLPIDAGPGRRFVPWLIALVVFLAALALGGLMTLADAAGRWDQGLSGTLTVQVPDIGNGDAQGTAQQQKRVEGVMKALKGTQGIASARALTSKETAALLEPFLGDSGYVATLPVPTVIDVRMQSSARVNISGLSDLLSTAAPGTTVDDHRRWTDRLVTILRAVEVLAAVIVGLVTLAAIGTVVFATRSALAVHAETIELLHVIGATDSVIASAFAGQALGLGLKGGMIGLVGAIVAGGGIAFAFSRLPVGLLPKLTLSPLEGVVLLLVPLVVAGIAALTARRTVMKSLKRML
jgi:cell division transport system permease protein